MHRGAFFLEALGLKVLFLVMQKTSAITYIKEVLTRANIPCEHCELEAMKGGGSMRRMTRIFPLGQKAGLLGSSFVLVENDVPQTFGKGIDENDSFLLIAEWLKAAGQLSPNPLDFDLPGRRYILEDLGEVHLLDRVNDVRKRALGDEALKPLYKSVLDDVITMQIFMKDHFDQARVHSLPYDFELMREWESGYFQQRFLVGLLGFEAVDQTLEQEFDELARRGAALDASAFVYRDLQSTNVMWHQGRWRYIDFQGGRSGPLHYDVASLIYDPYVALSFELRQELLTYFAQEAESKLGLCASDFLAEFPLIAVHRMMQALGAFGLLAKEKKKLWFLEHIPVAAKHLKELLATKTLAHYPHLREVASQIAQQLATGRLDSLKHELSNS
jgi:N-acetylmuramate 1-kinase